MDLQVDRAGSRGALAAVVPIVKTGLREALKASNMVCRAVVTPGSRLLPGLTFGCAANDFSGDR